MSPNLGLELNAGILGGSINDGMLNLSLSIPVQPGVSVGGTVFIDLNNGGSIVGGSVDISILKFISISVGRKGCTEFITISIGISPPKNNSRSNKRNNKNDRGNSRNNGKNDHGGRTNRNNRNREKPPIRHGEQTRIQDSDTRLQDSTNDRLQQLQREISDMRDGEEKSSKIREMERLQDLQDNLEDRNHNLQDKIQDRIRDKPRE